VAVRDNQREEFYIAIPISDWEHMCIGTLKHRDIKFLPWRLLEERVVRWTLNAIF